MKRIIGILKIALPYIFAVAICLFLSYTVGYQNLSLDEAFSVRLARMTVRDLVISSAKDVHPPLYYLILKLFGFFGGQSLLSYRIISVTPIWLILCYFGAFKLSKKYGLASSILFIVIFGGAYYTCEEAVNVRMYSFAAFFVIAAFFYSLEWFETKKNVDLILASVFTVCAMYTHYFALLFCFFMWIVWGGEQILLTFKNKKEINGIKKLAVCAGVFIVIYIPWFGTILAQGKRLNESGWLNTATFDWGNWWNCLPEIMQNSNYGWGILTAIITVLLCVSGVISKKKGVIEGFIAFFFTMITGALISLFISPLWATRFGYTFACIIPLLSAISISKVSFSDSKEKVVSLIVRLLIIAVFVINCYISFDYYVQNEAWTVSGKEWYYFAKSEIDGNTVLIADPSEHWIIYEYYLPSSKILMVPTENDLANLDRSDVIGGTSNDNGDIWFITDVRLCPIDEETAEHTFMQWGYNLDYVDTYFIRYKSLFVYKAVTK